MPNARTIRRSRWHWRLTHRVASGITHIPVQSPVIGEGGALLHSRAKALSAKCGADSMFNRCSRGSFELLFVLKGASLCNHSVHSWALSTATDHSEADVSFFWFHFHMSWAHLQSSLPLSQHMQIRGIYDSKHPRGKLWVIMWFCDCSAVCPGCFSLYTHICCEGLLGLWSKNEKSFMDLVY